jgi:hypothetical protein
MDNQTHNSENEWVEGKVAGLVAPGNWHPDSRRAFAQFLQRRDRQEVDSSLDGCGNSCVDRLGGDAAPVARAVETFSVE